MRSMHQTAISTAMADRARGGDLLTEAELHELDGADVLSLGMLADEVRRARVGDEVGYTRVLEVPAQAAGAVAAAGDAGEIRMPDVGLSLAATLGRIAEVREAAGAVRLTGFSLARLASAGWGPLSEVLPALRQAGLDLLAEAPVDLVTPADLDAVFASGLGLGRLSVQRPVEEGRVGLLLRIRDVVRGLPQVTTVAPLPREQSVATPTTGYHDVRLIALARLALPATPDIEVDWLQYGPKLAQVALTFGANRLDRVPLDDDPALGHRRTRVEDVRRNITAAGFVPVERGSAP